MAGEKWLIDADVFQRGDPFIGNDFQHAVNQQERITMRQIVQNFMDVHA
jgi:hypothetical protein